MKCYSDGFRLIGDSNPHPGKAHTWKTLSHARNSFAEFAADCDNFGMGEPAPLWVYIGKPDGDEDKYGYPDCADYYIEAGPRGGVYIKRAG